MTDVSSVAPNTNVRCPRCLTDNGRGDHYCGGCGEALARLVAPLRMSVGETSRLLQVHIGNRGKSPASVVVRKRDLQDMPPWLLSVSPCDQALQVGPAERATFTLEVDPSRLPAARRRQGEALNPNEAAFFKLLVLTSQLASDASGAQVQRQWHQVAVAAQSRPRLSPEVSFFRFLPLERLLDRIYAREVRLTNEGGQPIEVVKVGVADVPPAGRPELAQGHVQVRASMLAVCPPLHRRQQVQAGGVFSYGFALELSPENASVLGLDDGKVGAFSFDLVINTVSEEAPAGIEVKTRLAGFIGAGPKVALCSGPPPHQRCRGSKATGQVRLHNPGVVPVALTAIQILDANGHEVTEPDWLQLLVAERKQAERNTILAPQEVLEIPFVIDPDQRPPEALHERYGERQVRFLHDGYGPTELLVPITAELGEVKTLQGATLGVDFGTSNSSVALLHGPSGLSKSLVLEPQAHQEQLRSLMFYRGQGAQGTTRSPFLYGQAALNAAPINYANLVRSMKSVVVRDPEQVWAFVEASAEASAAASSGASADGAQLRTFRSQQLLELFISEVKRRAEEGIFQLDVRFLEELDLLGSSIRFSRAVFTHPVGVDTHVLRALHQAALVAHLCEAQITEEMFVAHHCLDEALAAVLAWVYVMAQPGAPSSLAEQEHLLCFDVGGGTTDLAAVLVQGLPGFVAGQSDHVQVQLLASGGDRRFGGDDIDRLLAELLLDKLAASELGRDLDLNGVRQALRHPSFESFRRTFDDGAGTEAAAATLARALFSKAVDLLGLAESAKRTLSGDNACPVSIPLSDWPVLRGASSVHLRADFELLRGELQTSCAPAFAQAASRIPALLSDANWTADNVTTMLFTGQGTRVPDLRQAATARLQQARTSDAPPLNVVEPGNLSGFDEKRCVAMGAAVWGDSQAGGGGWLRITHRATDTLPYTLQTRRGPRFVDVQGLQAGAVYPAQATIHFGAPAGGLTLFRGGELMWTFVFDVLVSEVTVTLSSDREAIVQNDQIRVIGQRETGTTS